MGHKLISFVPQADEEDEDRRLKDAHLLLRYNADPQRTDEKGRTAAELAEAAGRHRLALMLRGEKDRRVCAVLLAERERADKVEIALKPSGLMRLPRRMLLCICEFVVPLEDHGRQGSS